MFAAFSYVLETLGDEEFQRKFWSAKGELGAAARVKQPSMRPAPPRPAPHAEPITGIRPWRRLERLVEMLNAELGHSP